MMTTATHNEYYAETPAAEPVLFLAFELSEKTWKLGFTTGHGQQPRERNIAARHQERLLQEVAQAKRRSLNLSLFVEDQNGPGIGQTLPFSLCSRLLGLMPLVRSVPPARTHSADESSGGIERSPRILGDLFC